MGFGEVLMIMARRNWIWSLLGGKTGGFRWKISSLPFCDSIHCREETNCILFLKQKRSRFKNWLHNLTAHNIQSLKTEDTRLTYRQKSISIRIIKHKHVGLFSKWKNDHHFF